MGNNLQRKSKKHQEIDCEKVFKALSSPLRTRRRVSKPNQSTDSVAKTRPNPETVHVKFAEPWTQTAKPVSKKKVARVETAKTDEGFNEYIKKAKLKIRAMTNLGENMNADVTEAETETHVPVSVSKDSSGKDQFSEFIKKAKMKLSATSSMGHGNSKHDSFKRVKN